MFMASQKTGRRAVFSIGMVWHVYGMSEDWAQAGTADSICFGCVTAHFCIAKTLHKQREILPRGETFFIQAQQRYVHIKIL